MHNEFKLPSGWATADLGAVTQPRGLKRKPAEVGDAPFIGLESIESHTMRLLNVKRTGDVKSAGSYFENADVLYSRLRPYLNKVYMPDFYGLVSGEFIVFPKQDSLDNAYLKYFLNRVEFASHATRLNAGDRPRVDFSQLADYPFPLPPLAEQHRIVAEIERHLTRLDASVAALKRVQGNLKRYRASVLKDACEGKLVPTESDLAHAEGRDYEPADRLLERILSERRAHRMARKNRRVKHKEPVAPDTSTLPGLPEGWVWSKVGQSFDVYVGSTPKRARPDFWNGDIPWVSSGEVSNGRIKSTRESITQEGFENSSVNLHPVGTVLLGMIGEGKTRGQVSILDIPACNNQNSAAIRVSESGLPPEYVFYYLWGQYDATRRVGSGNNQPALNKTRVQELLLPLPPLAEQRRIVAEVERRLSVIQQTEAAVEANLTRAERLRQSILKQAFAGNLVPQDPNDEPASVLLERIRAEREAAQAKAKLNRKPRRRTGKSRKRQPVPKGATP